MIPQTLIEAQIADSLRLAQREAPFLALDDGYPVSGDALRAYVHDPHPTQPFRLGDLLWPLVTDTKGASA